MKIHGSPGPPFVQLQCVRTAINMAPQNTPQKHVSSSTIWRGDVRRKTAGGSYSLGVRYGFDGMVTCPDAVSKFPVSAPDTQSCQGPRCNPPRTSSPPAGQLNAWGGLSNLQHEDKSRTAGGRCDRALA
jgi:hypothetical protein